LWLSEELCPVDSYVLHVSKLVASKQIAKSIFVQ